MPSPLRGGDDGAAARVELARTIASGNPEKAAAASDLMINDLFDFARKALP